VEKWDVDNHTSSRSLTHLAGNLNNKPAARNDHAAQPKTEPAPSRFALKPLALGWDLGQPFITTTPDFWAKVVDINYLGVESMCHTFVNLMIREGLPGHVVNIGSDAGRVGSMGEAVYAGAKGAVMAFSKSLAREMARYGINVNCVCPGPTDTKLFYEQPEKVRNAVVRAIPLRRVAQPQELASAVAYFASDEASYVTGQVLSVSGGLTMCG
jgi:2-hydroxycyclohexanecarboxyl-CoA dehydrogenase